MHASSETLPKSIVRFGFTKLEEVAEQEFVFGIAGKFWRWDGGLRRLADRDAFLVFAEDGYVKGAWNLLVVPAANGTTELSTETRVQCLGPAARQKFRLYWAFVGPFSGLIRRALLRGVRRRAEGLA